jgi:hypothetical protein
VGENPCDFCDLPLKPSDDEGWLLMLLGEDNKNALSSMGNINFLGLAQKPTVSVGRNEVGKRCRMKAG